MHWFKSVLCTTVEVYCQLMLTLNSPKVIGLFVIMLNSPNPRPFDISFSTMIDGRWSMLKLKLIYTLRTAGHHINTLAHEMICFFTDGFDERQRESWYTSTTYPRSTSKLDKIYSWLTFPFFSQADKYYSYFRKTRECKRKPTLNRIRYQKAWRHTSFVISSVEGQYLQISVWIRSKFNCSLQKA
jgi:hypothetical protein